MHKFDDNGRRTLTHPTDVAFSEGCPGIGSSIDPATGRSMDNVKPMIENIEWLSAENRKTIFEDNARAVFKLAVA